jgi:hypothetical protein
VSDFQLFVICFDVNNRLIGSLVATTQVLILPALIALAHPITSSSGTGENKERVTGRLCSILSQKQTAYVLVVTGVLVGTTGTIVFTVKLASQFT